MIKLTSGTEKGQSISVSSFGIIGIGGVIAFIIGSNMLFDTQDPNYYLNWALILIMSILTIAFFFMFITLAISSHKRKVTTGEEGLIGMTGIVLSVSHRKATVRVLGEIWEAHSSQKLIPGEEIKVEKTIGLVLYVKPIKK